METEVRKTNCDICGNECIPSFILTIGKRIIYMCDIKCYKVYLYRKNHG